MHAVHREAMAHVSRPLSIWQRCQGVQVAWPALRCRITVRKRECATLLHMVVQIGSA